MGSRWEPEEDRFILDHPELNGRELHAHLGGKHGRPDNYNKRRERLLHAQESRDLIASGTVKPIEFPKSVMADARNTNIIKADSFLTISDLHAPHQDAPFLEQVCTTAQAWGITQCIVNGDLFDFSAFSTHGRLENDPPLKEELKAVRSIIAMLSGLFEQVTVDLGNHEYRWLRRSLNSALDVDDWTWLFSRSDNVRVINYGYVFVHGAEKWLVGHPQKYSRDAAKVALNIHIESFPDHHVIVGHDHHVGMSQHVNSLGKFWNISQGCCALVDTFEFCHRDVSGMRAMNQGAVIVKDNYPHLLIPATPWGQMTKMYAA